MVHVRDRQRASFVGSHEEILKAALRGVELSCRVSREAQVSKAFNADVAGGCSFEWVLPVESRAGARVLHLRGRHVGWAGLLRDYFAITTKASRSAVGNCTVGCHA